MTTAIETCVMRKHNCRNTNADQPVFVFAVAKWFERNLFSARAKAPVLGAFALSAQPPEYARLTVWLRKLVDQPEEHRAVCWINRECNLVCTL